MPVPQGQVKSGEASSKTLQRRSHCLSGLLEVVSAGDGKSQLSHEIKLFSKEEREQLLNMADLPVVIPAGQGLAMKADLSLSWDKLRIIRR